MLLVQVWSGGLLLLNLYAPNDGTNVGKILQNSPVFDLRRVGRGVFHRVVVKHVLRGGVTRGVRKADDGLTARNTE